MNIHFKFLKAKQSFIFITYLFGFSTSWDTCFHLEVLGFCTCLFSSKFKGGPSIDEIFSSSNLETENWVLSLCLVLSHFGNTLFSFKHCYGLWHLLFVFCIYMTKLRLFKNSVFICTINHCLSFLWYEIKKIIDLSKIKYFIIKRLIDISL